MTVLADPSQATLDTSPTVLRTVRRVLQHPDPFLRKTCREVTVFDDALRVFCDELVFTMKILGGAGLAAPQVGDERRVFVMAGGLSGVAPRVVINPKVLATSKQSAQMVEGCLSLVNQYVEISRPETIEVSFTTYTPDGKLEDMRFKAGGMFARVFHHEWEHLNGRMFFDRVKDRNVRSRLSGGR